MLAILDYKAGNQTSVRRALDHLGIENRITADPDLLSGADGIIFPAWARPARPWTSCTPAAWTRS